MKDVEKFIFKDWETKGTIENESGGTHSFNIFDYFAWRIGFEKDSFYADDTSDEEGNNKLRCEPTIKIDGKTINPLEQTDFKKWKQYILKLNEMKCSINLTTLKTFFVELS